MRLYFVYEFINIYYHVINGTLLFIFGIDIMK